MLGRPPHPSQPWEAFPGGLSIPRNPGHLACAPTAYHLSTRTQPPSRVPARPPTQVLRSQAEALARAQYARTKDPHDCALVYVALGRKSVLQGLFRSSGNVKVPVGGGGGAARGGGGGCCRACSGALSS